MLVAATLLTPLALGTKKNESTNAPSTVNIDFPMDNNRLEGLLKEILNCEIPVPVKEVHPMVRQVDCKQGKVRRSAQTNVSRRTELGITSNSKPQTEAGVLNYSTTCNDVLWLESADPTQQPDRPMNRTDKNAIGFCAVTAPFMFIKGIAGLCNAWEGKMSHDYHYDAALIYVGLGMIAFVAMFLVVNLSGRGMSKIALGCASLATLFVVGGGAMLTEGIVQKNADFIANVESDKLSDAFLSLGIIALIIGAIAMFFISTLALGGVCRGEQQ